MNLQDRINNNKKELEQEGITEPCIDKEYWCETCGSKSGECNPITGMCFICGADDWCPVTMCYNLLKTRE